MDATALWRFVREMMAGVDAEELFGAGFHARQEDPPGEGAGRQDGFRQQTEAQGQAQRDLQQQTQQFQEEILRAQQLQEEAQRQAVQQARLFQQEQIDRFNWQSVNSIPDGGFVPPLPPPPPTPPF